MPTINQLVRKGRKKIIKKINSTGPEKLSAETRRMYTRVYDYPEEAELSIAQNCQGKINQWDRSNRLYPRNRS